MVNYYLLKLQVYWVQFYKKPDSIPTSSFDFCIQCVKSVRIRSYSGPYLAAFRLNIQSECRKIGTRITPNMDTFHVMIIFQKRRASCVQHLKNICERLFPYSFLSNKRLAILVLSLFVTLSLRRSLPYRNQSIEL